MGERPTTNKRKCSSAIADILHNYGALGRGIGKTGPTRKGLIERRKGHLVRMKGLEPSRISTPEPKSGASTNFATSARKAIVTQFAALRQRRGKEAKSLYNGKLSGIDQW